jgi:Fe-Mn family superoxide dismutase
MPTKVHEMPALPYAHDALAPHISRETIEYHYGKHLQTYVTNLNNLIPGTPFENASLEDIIRKADGGIFNNGAQIWNHTFYFLTFSPQGQKVPTGKLAEAIDGEFGSFDAFKEQFTKQATGLFGSGWTWLVKDGGKLKIVNGPNAGNPLRDGMTPLMTMDVWEPAYYIDSRNRRAASIKATWEVIDWKIVVERF